MMFGDHNWGWGNWLGMSLVMVVFWGALLWLIVMLVRGMSKSEATPARHVEQLLAERFARGEIDETEYQHRLSVLRHESDPDQPRRHRTRLDKAGAGR